MGMLNDNAVWEVTVLFRCCFILQLYGIAVVSTTSPQHEGPGFEFAGWLGPFCVEFKGLCYINWWFKIGPMCAYILVYLSLFTQP